MLGQPRGAAGKCANGSMWPISGAIEPAGGLDTEAGQKGQPSAPSSCGPTMSGALWGVFLTVAGSSRAAMTGTESEPGRVELIELSRSAGLMGISHQFGPWASRTGLAR